MFFGMSINGGKSMDHSETFHDETWKARLKWHNQPRDVFTLNGQLIVRPEAETDFWQKTYYGFTPDNGHFLYLELSGDFDLETHVHFSFAHEFDQAGLMVRADAEHWLKTSVEYQTQGPSSLGAVITNIYSDWSVSDFEGTHVYLRVRRLGDVFGVYHSVDAQNWRLMRIGKLPISDQVKAGLYACSPKGAGFEARFDYLMLLPPGSREFH